jgi:DNA topoisomerase-1
MAKNTREISLPKLHSVNDDDTGITRSARRGKFIYRDPNGRIIKTEQELCRIRSLAIPPAWTAVWICPDPVGHIQATGRDARGRKQYRYHRDWRARREAQKTTRLLLLAENLAAIRRRVRRDLTKPGLPRAKVLALMVKLLDLTAIRPGHREYAQQNGSYGLASMKDAHARIQGESVAFQFNGKGGKRQSLAVEDKGITKLVAQCRRLSGSALFQYVDEHGRPRPVHAGDLNRYLNEISKTGVTAKDLRTWNATVAAWELLWKKRKVETGRQRKAALRDVICAVAEQLGNTPSIAAHPTFTRWFRRRF